MANDERRGFVDREPDLSAAERFVRDWAKAMTVRNRRPLPTDFSHVPRRQAEADEREAIAIRKGFKFSGTERGFLIEETLLHLIEGADWFGENTFVSSATDYDDVKNGADGVIEVIPSEQGDRVPRVAFDVASGTAAEGLAKKLEKILYGGQVRYFRSEAQVDDEGEPTDMSLTGIPFVVLGLDAGLFGSLATTMYDARNKTGRRDPATNQMIPPSGFDQSVLANHPVKALLLEQACVQLRHQRGNLQAVAILAHVEAELEKIKSSPEFRRAAVMGKQSPTHRGLTLAR